MHTHQMDMPKTHQVVGIRGSRGGNFGCDTPLNIGEIAARHGLGWGGNWSRPGSMHFSAASVERSISIKSTI